MTVNRSDWRSKLRLAFHFRHRFFRPGPGEKKDTDYCIAVAGCNRRRPE